MVSVAMTARHFAEIGFLITHTNRRNGFAIESVAVMSRHAFSCLEVHRLTAVTQPENFVAALVLERCGFQREGILRDAHFNGRTFCDLAIYSRISGDPDPTPSLRALSGAKSR
jgi:RimJ/RimL family protein N-acetyltransferase